MRNIMNPGDFFFENTNVFSRAPRIQAPMLTGLWQVI